MIDCLVTTISSYVKLTKVGCNYVGQCPFHESKQPTFVISTSQQKYFCIDCGRVGDKDHFLNEIENKNGGPDEDRQSN